MRKILFSYLFFLLLPLGCASNINTINNNNVQKVPVENVSDGDTIKKSVPIYKLSLVIKDSNTQKPLEKVKVTLSDSTGLNMNLESDKNGKVEITLPNPSKILVSCFYEGYQSFVSFESLVKEGITKEVLLKPVYTIIQN